VFEGKATSAQAWTGHLGFQEVQAVIEKSRSLSDEKNGQVHVL
jgi:hypothetical protein